MATVLTGKKYLIGHFLAEGEAHNTQLVIQNDNGTFSYSSFEVETHSTIWISGIVAAIRQDELNDFILDDLEMMKNRGDSLAQINNYLKSSNLYAISKIDITTLIQI